METEVSRRLLAWYAQSSRPLPWRGLRDAYAVWVSEIMLQQTRVETVIPYFQRWMECFSDLPSLAAASQQEVLQLWEGLGYYSRARNLHRAARLVMSEYGGQIPSDRAQLERLPGVGKYTAGAIASIAFGQDAPALDGNIRRVLSRLFNVDLVAGSSQAERRLWGLAAEHLPPGHAGDYNQALMDLGASLCTPQAPNCLLCPLAELCQARALSIQEQRPVRKSRPTIPHHTVSAAVIHQDGDVLIAQRPSQGLLGGLWEFPGGKLEPGENLPGCLQREIQEELGVQIAVGEEIGVYQHAYTHFRVTLHAFDCTLHLGNPAPLEANQIAWVKPSELINYPMGKIDRLIARDLIIREENRLRDS